MSGSFLAGKPRPVGGELHIWKSADVNAEVWSLLPSSSGSLLAWSRVIRRVQATDTSRVFMQTRCRNASFSPEIDGQQEGRPRDEGGLLTSRLFAVGSAPLAVFPLRLGAWACGYFLPAPEAW